MPVPGILCGEQFMRVGVLVWADAELQIVRQSHVDKRMSAWTARDEVIVHRGCKLVGLALGEM